MNETRRNPVAGRIHAMSVTTSQIKQVMSALRSGRDLTPEEDRWFDQWMNADAALQAGE
jgi:hypothetical protein